MRKSSVKCGECRFWIPYVEEDPERGPRLTAFGLCCQHLSGYWLSSMHKDGSCMHGELKIKATNNQ
jgi:hypothetical protein